MSIRSLLRKELRWSRRHIFVLVFLLVALPLFFAGTSFLFQDVIPREVPVAVVAEDESVSNLDLGDDRDRNLPRDHVLKEEARAREKQREGNQ